MFEFVLRALVVAFRAHGLPVIHVPESARISSAHVSSMRYPVIDHRCHSRALDASLTVWAFAKRVRSQITCPGLAPLMTVSARASRSLATAPSACMRPRESSDAATQRRD